VVVAGRQGRPPIGSLSASGNRSSMRQFLTWLARHTGQFLHQDASAPSCDGLQACLFLLVGHLEGSAHGHACPVEQFAQLLYLIGLHQQRA